MVGKLAERVGFEPTVLSHTAFRERHHQPLGHLSAAESSKGTSRGPWTDRVRRDFGSARDSADGEVGAQVGGGVLEDARHDPEPGREPRRVGEPDSRAEQAPSRGSPSANTTARREPGAGRPCTSHTAPPAQKTIIPGCQRRPRRRDASRSRAMTGMSRGVAGSSAPLRGRAPPSPRRARRQHRQHARPPPQRARPRREPRA